MRLAIVTSGRFHLADLTRELTALGVDVTFYSLLPPQRTDRLGLPRSACRWLWPAIPAWALHTKLRTDLAQRAHLEAIDRSAALMLRACDALMVMSGMGYHTMLAARRRFGARIYVQRASRHIRSQKRILDAMPAYQGRPSAIPDWVVARELREYDAADEVVVPAHHVAQSFLDEGFPATRIWRNPFGTNFDQFYPTPLPPADAPPRFVFAGTWSYRKGVDVLALAFERLRQRVPNAELRHVGPVLDAPLPANLAGFAHEDAVPQGDLIARYAASHVFVMASREEGLAFVQAQALAAGLHLVCTDRTGGVDLGELTGAPVTVVAPDDPDALASAMEAAIPGARRARVELGAGRDALSWRAHAERWHDHLREMP